jgi:pyrroloquinoline quinone biosynthesis protein B
MRIRILGSAAGGGLPQWNCNCANCLAARSGSPAVHPRTQSSTAISPDGRAWFLLNMSADVRQQVSKFPELSPPEGSARGTTIAGCVLTDAEIDHSSGLLQLREGCTFCVFSTPTVRRWLTEYLPIRTVLAGFAERPWRDLTLDAPVELPLADGSPSGLTVRTFETGHDAPRFVPKEESNAADSVIGLQIRDRRTGGVLVYAPGVAAISAALADAAANTDCILLDGTFWTDNELVDLDISPRTARQMGHVPVSGPDGSLNWLTGLSIRHRVYVHINNTNPMLNEAGPERREVERHGVSVGRDGDVFEI